MPTQARVVVLQETDGPLEVQELNIPDPGPDQVVVRQFASGVCHSQLHQMHNPRRSPTLLGHESTGVVIQKGANVTHVEEGDTVLVTWVPRNAAETRKALLPATLELSNGTAVSQNVFTWADHTIADEQYVVKVDNDIPRDVTAVIGCAVMTGAGAVINTVDVQQDESVAVFGVGGVGLSAVAGAHARKAFPIIAVDLDEEKLEFAKKFGATHTVNASKGDAVEAIRSLTVNINEYGIGGQRVSGVDYAFDCIGHEITMKQITAAARPGHFGARQGGTAVLVGVPLTSLNLNVAMMLLTEKQFRGSIGGSCCPDRDFPIFLDWHQSGLLDLDAMITARYPIEEINNATGALEAGEISGRAILEFN